MIYREKSEFKEAVRKAVIDALRDPASSKDTGIFEIGDFTRGFSLAVSRHGWIFQYDGLILEKQTHIAAPLTNLQAGCEATCA